jgi:hypothetical protein
MKNGDVKQRFNEIKDKFKRGDAVRLSEMSRKSVEICSHIIKGRRNPQPWFMDVAEAYLKVLGRI